MELFAGDFCDDNLAFVGIRFSDFVKCEIKIQKPCRFPRFR